MQQTANIIDDVRTRLGVSLSGFLTESEALRWYRAHYRKAKGRRLTWGFGWRFTPARQSLEFDYAFDGVKGRISLSAIPPLDPNVPLDREILSLIPKLGIDSYRATALRLVILVGRCPDSIPEVPYYLTAPLGDWRLLVQAPGMVSGRERNRLLDVPAGGVRGLIQGFPVGRKTPRC